MQTPKLLTKKHMIASFLMVDISRVIRQAVDEQMRKVGLTRAQWFILHYVYHYEGTTQQELADMVDMGKSALAKQLVTLEAKGWLYKLQHETDGRSFRVYVSPNMKPSIEEINEMAEMTLSPVLDRLDSNQTNTLLTSLDIIDKHIESDLQTSSSLTKANQMIQTIKANKLSR